MLVSYAPFQNSSGADPDRGSGSAWPQLWACSASGPVKPIEADAAATAAIAARNGVIITNVLPRLDLKRGQSRGVAIMLLDDGSHVESDTITEAWGSRVRFRASRTLSRHRRMRQKRASAGNRNQVIPAI